MTRRTYNSSTRLQFLPLARRGESVSLSDCSDCSGWSNVCQNLSARECHGEGMKAALLISRLLGRAIGGGRSSISGYCIKASVSENSAPFSLTTAKRLSARDFSPVVLRYIRQYISACRERGVRVILLPPAYQAQSYDNQSEYIRKIEQELERGGMPFHAPTKRYRLDGQYFYDTPYHLNLVGRRIRTQMVIEDLEGYLQNATGIR